MWPHNRRLIEAQRIHASVIELHANLANLLEMRDVTELQRTLDHLIKVIEAESE